MQPEVEFSRRFAVAELGEEEAVVEIAADAVERAALCRRFDFLALDALTATVRIQRVGGGAVRVGAHFVAEVVQACVVTLEPVAGRIENSVAALFAPPGAMVEAEVVVDPLGDDEPEWLTGGAIDIGEVVAEHLGLAVEPYPRRPGAVFTGMETSADENGAGESPFAVLRDIDRESSAPQARLPSRK